MLPPNRTGSPQRGAGCQKKTFPLSGRSVFFLTSPFIEPFVVMVFARFKIRRRLGGFQPSLTGRVAILFSVPGVETPGYFRASLRDLGLDSRFRLFPPLGLGWILFWEWFPPLGLGRGFPFWESFPKWEFGEIYLVGGIALEFEVWHCQKW